MADVLALFLTLGTTATHFRKWLTYIQGPLTVVRQGLPYSCAGPSLKDKFTLYPSLFSVSKLTACTSEKISRLKNTTPTFSPKKKEKKVHSVKAVGTVPNAHLRVGLTHVASRRKTLGTRGPDRAQAAHLLYEHVCLRHDLLDAAKVIGHALLALLPHTVRIQQECLARLCVL